MAKIKDASKANASNKKDKKYNFIFFFGAVSIPLIFMLYFYQNGENAIYVKFSYLMALTGILCLISAVIWLISKLIFKSPLSAFIVSLLAFIALFTSNPISEKLPITHFKTVIIYTAFMIIAVILAILIKKKITDYSIPAAFISIMLIIMLLFNLIPSLTLVEKQRKVNTILRSLKESYVVDETLDSPNVYWIHTDGMVGFDTIETYFNDTQDDFSNALEELGFYVSRSAEFEADHRTLIAVPALMCPDFYDEYLASYLESGNGLIELQSAEYSEKLFLARSNNECEMGFSQKDYNVNIISMSLDNAYFPVTEGTDRYYTEGELYTENFKAKNTFEFNMTQLMEFCKAFSFTIFKSIEYILENFDYQISDYYTSEMTGEALTSEEIEEMYSKDLQINLGVRLNRELNAMNDILTSSEKPYIVVYSFMGAHYPYSTDEYGHSIENTPRSLQSYYQQHKYCAKYIIGLVTMIREKDPDAVIVIQSDHGTHTLTSEDIIAQTGDEAAPKAFWNQVMSAVYIPEKYRTEGYEEILSNPLNITRYLINTFVGDNYEYR